MEESVVWAKRFLLLLYKLIFMTAKLLNQLFIHWKARRRIGLLVSWMRLLHQRCWFPGIVWWNIKRRSCHASYDCRLIGTIRVLRIILLTSLIAIINWFPLILIFNPESIHRIFRITHHHHFHSAQYWLLHCRIVAIIFRANPTTQDHPAPLPHSLYRRLYHSSMPKNIWASVKRHILLLALLDNRVILFIFLVVNHQSRWLTVHPRKYRLLMLLLLLLSL